MRPSGAFKRPDSPDRLDAVDARQHHVHQHRVECALRDPLGGILAASDEFGLMTEFGEHRVEHDAAERIVLDAENAQAARLSRRRIGVGARTGGLRRLGAGQRTLKVNVVPPPRRGATSMSPPIARASAFTEDSPRPAPPKREAIETLACENGRNSRLISFSVRPIPLSETAKATPTLPSGAAHRPDRERDAAGFGELDRIVDQVFQRRAQADGIADHERRQFFGNFDVRLQALGRRAAGQRIANAARERAQIEEILPNAKPGDRGFAPHRRTMSRGWRDVRRPP